jgi:hypothetical protein
MASNVTMEIKVHSLQQLNNAIDTVLLNNVGKVGELILIRSSCHIFLEQPLA